MKKTFKFLAILCLFQVSGLQAQNNFNENRNQTNEKQKTTDRNNELLRERIERKLEKSENKIRERIQKRMEEQIDKSDGTNQIDQEIRQIHLNKEIDRLMLQYKNRAIDRQVKLIEEKRETLSKRKADINVKTQNRAANKGNKNTLLTEKEILIEFYNATDGDNWYNNANWLSDEPLDTWYGIEMFGEDVSAISLSNNNLSGSIPESFYELSFLMYLDLGMNSLFGEISQSIENFFWLYNLDLSYNEFSGILPESIWLLFGLEELKLSSNNFEGEIPNDIVNLEYLNFLGLSWNNFSGNIPDGITYLFELESLYLNWNNFNGILPDGFSNLQNLKYLDLSANKFTGNVPEAIWLTTSLESLYLGFNRLSGEIPSDIGNLTNLYDLDLMLNEFTNEMPDVYNEMQNLSILWLGYNNFTGEFPASILYINSLGWLDLSYNYFEGNIPQEISNLTNLWNLDIQYNSFSGAIPNNIGDLINLEELYLNNNKITGNIPNSIGQLENAYLIYLQSNQLTGTLPISLSNLSDPWINISDNMLDSIPVDFNNTALTLLLWDNYFTFDDILNLPNDLHAFTFPQKPIPLTDKFIITDQSPISYQIPIDNNITSNTYKWYRDNEIFHTSNVDTIEIIEDLNGNTHIYKLEIENEFIPNEKIVSEPISVYTLSDCGYLMDFDYEGSSCESAQLFDLTESSESEIISWSWNFGDPESAEYNYSNDQNPQHYFVGNKSQFEVELIVKDNNQCADTLIKTVQPDYPKASISGTVTYGVDNPITKGYILVYLLSDGVISTKVDSVNIPEKGNGRYKTRELATCLDYIITAYPNPDDYPGILPRWHNDAYYWYNATPVSLHWDDPFVTHIDIDLYEIGDPPTGTSTIGGGIYYLDNKGEPVKNIDVVLEHDIPDERVYEVVGYMVSDNVGKWRFNNLGLGTYKVKVDIPGLEMDSVYTININEPNTIITNLNYYVDINNGITTNQTGIEEIENNPFNIIMIPNPNNGQFLIEIQNNAGADNIIKQLEILSIDGMLQRNYQIEELIEDQFEYRMNMSHLKSGVYLLKVSTNDSQSIRKFIVQ